MQTTSTNVTNVDPVDVDLHHPVNTFPSHHPIDDSPTPTKASMSSRKVPLQNGYDNEKWYDVDTSSKESIDTSSKESNHHDPNHGFRVPNRFRHLHDRFYRIASDRREKAIAMQCLGTPNPKYWPSAGALYFHCAKFVSNEAFYKLDITRELAAHIVVTADAPGYLRRTRTEGHSGYSCIGKFFGDILEKLVMVIFDDMRWYESHGRWHKSHWYEIPSANMREALEELGVIDIDREYRRFKDNVTGFASRIPRVVLGNKNKDRRRRILVDFGFQELEDCKDTVFLDLAVVDPDLRHEEVLDILEELGRQHMRLAFVLEGYYDQRIPSEIVYWKDKCNRFQPSRWFQLAGALFMDKRNLDPEGNLKYHHLVRLYDKNFPR
ncbi:hypothetical protein HD553DRAFT_337080 [Filobasidium floriforme]|uniref:uncharacterized protein n=1 Tax=Filobasidium floriforme TaxID=5210 RepID=UPI001E8D4A9E|nr:uncharacterized protein HD553DRAFT_337080 [Filobasidium floriforme]KAH8079908.1 hypothetical protein HD553DRAFT_337080 [Filobasidium floriforme]